MRRNFEKARSRQQPPKRPDFVPGLALVVVLSLCSSCGTSYGPMGFAGGYDDRQINATQFFVKVNGNGFTSETTLVGYFHRRARDLCQGIGYSNYTFSSESVQTVDAGEPTYTAELRRTGRSTATVRLRQDEGFSVTKYAVKGYVSCNDPVQEQGNAGGPESLVPPVQHGDRETIDAVAYFELGNTLFKERKFAQALSAYQTAADADPTSARTQRALGIVFAILERDAESARAYREYLRLAPNARDADRVRRILVEYEKTNVRPTH